MPHSLPPLAWFRAFESAARLLSFTAAADELAMTQPAISQHVKSLEVRFGAPLFIRKPRGLVLTDAGRRLLPEVTEALARLAAATDRFTPGVSGDQMLTIATSVSFAHWYLAPGLAEFQRQNPGVRVRLISTVWPDDFVASTADLEIRFGAPDLVGQAATRLADERLILVAAPGYLEHVPLEEGLLSQPLIQTVGTSDGWPGWTAAHHLPAAPPAILVDNYGAAIDFACAGAGIALVSNLLAAPALADRKLQRISELDTPANDGYFLAVRPTDNQQDSESFCRWLRDHIDSVGQRAARQTGN